MEEKTIQSVPVVPFAMMMAVISAIIGLIMGIIFAGLFGAVLSSIPSTVLPGTGTTVNFGMLSALFGLGAVISMPIAGFIGGLIQGLIIALLYNFLAPRIGGIKLRFKESPSPLQT
jgi:hypothetical protein